MNIVASPQRRRFSVVFLVPLLMALVISACAKTSSPTTAGSGSTATSTATASTDSCASAGTRHLTKARILGDLGISAGAFHRYIYKPLKSGSFSQASTLHKGLMLAKAAAAALVIKHFLGNAIDNARADATLCKYVPSMQEVEASLGTLASHLKSGDTSSLDTSNGLFAKLQQQAGFAPNENASLPTG